MNTEIELLFFLLGVGLCIGVLSGFFGIGGAFILTPLLTMLGFPVTNAIATGLLFTLGVSILGGVKHYLAGNTSLKIFLFVSLFSLAGISISKPLMMYLSSEGMCDYYFEITFILLLFFMGFLTYFKKLKSEPPAKSSGFFRIINRIPPFLPGTDEATESIWSRALQRLTVKLKGQAVIVIGFIKFLPPYIYVEENKKISLWSLVSIGLIVGFLKGFLGVGGGFMLVPLFIFLLDMPVHKAVGTSLPVLFFSSVYASGLYIASVEVQLSTVAVLVLGAFIGVRFGVKAMGGVADEKLKQLYALFLLLAGTGILLKHLDYATISLVYMITVLVLVSGLVFYYYTGHAAAGSKNKKA